MSKQSLEMNFNEFEANSERQELQKAQAYINALNTQLEALQKKLEDYIAAHP